MNLNISANKNGVGVIIVKVNLASDLSATLISQIQDLLNKYKFVVFKEQHLPNEQLNDFAFRFGPPFVPDNKSPVMGSKDNKKAKKSFCPRANTGNTHHGMRKADEKFFSNANVAKVTKCNKCSITLQGNKVSLQAGSASKCAIPLQQLL